MYKERKLFFTNLIKLTVKLKLSGFAVPKKEF